MDNSSSGSRWGDRLRARARELNLTDAEVARRLGLTQGRYSSYVNQTREPDFLTFVRICRTLSTRPDTILGFSDPAEVESDTGRDVARAVGILTTLDPGTLGLATALLEVLAEKAAREAPHKAAPLHGQEAARAGRQRARPGRRVATRTTSSSKPARQE